MSYQDGASSSITYHCSYCGVALSKPRPTWYRCSCCSNASSGPLTLANCGSGNSLDSFYHLIHGTKSDDQEFEELLEKTRDFIRFERLSSDDIEKLLEANKTVPKMVNTWGTWGVQTGRFSTEKPNSEFIERMQPSEPVDLTEYDFKGVEQRMVDHASQDQYALWREDVEKAANAHNYKPTSFAELKDMLAMGYGHKLTGSQSFSDIAKQERELVERKSQRMMQFATLREELESLEAACRKYAALGFDISPDVQALIIEYKKHLGDIPYGETQTNS